jgi:transposase
MKLTNTTPEGREAIRAVRLEASKLFNKGLRCADIARRLGLTRTTVSIWRKRWREGGVEALLHVGGVGIRRRLSDKQLGLIVEELLKGPKAHGWESEYWTLARIGALIEAKTGVSYSIGYLWHLMHRLNWSCQKPDRRAKERNQQKIDRWVAEEWPRIKKGR